MDLRLKSRVAAVEKTMRPASSESHQFIALTVEL